MNRIPFKDRSKNVNEKQAKAREYRRKWYYKNKERTKTNVVARKDALDAWFLEYKSRLKCKKCSECHPACLDFHHRDNAEKELNVGKAVDKGWCKERILKEIAKCDVLCSNCHRKLHWEERIQCSNSSIGGATDSKSGG